MSTKKKKLLWLSDNSKLTTGFGRNSKAVLSYLYKTGKYEIVEYSCAPITFKDERLKGLPWKGYGAMPEDEFLKNEISRNPHLGAGVKYGGFYIDEIIEKERPDAFIGVNDFWAFDGFYDKPWWNKINCALWVTLDSLPIYEPVLANAHKIKNFWVWSRFAEKEMHAQGFEQVKTLHGAFDISNFTPLPEERVAALRKKNGIDDNDFIVGFVFRNQLRKLVGSLIEGFSIYKKNNPGGKAKLLLHTSWSEGWDIPSFIKEYGVDKGDVLTTFVCTSCKEYHIKSFDADKTSCPHCGGEKTATTPKSYFGVDDSKMNELYNMMDFYVHPITSGGLEMPIAESLMAGTPVATVNYSCGEEFCDQPFVQKINHTIYREFKSQFKKSQTCPISIAKLLEENENNRARLEDFSLAGREWSEKEFDHNIICAQIEEWLDACPAPRYDFALRSRQENDTYPFRTDIEDDTEWAIDLISNVFGKKESARSPVIRKVVEKLNEGSNREFFYKKTIESAKKFNALSKKNSAAEYFKDDSEVDNFCFVAPDDFGQKLLLIEKVKELIGGCKNLFIVGSQTDGEVYGQCGKFTIIPKGERSSQINWLKTLVNKNGAPRFKKIFYTNNNVFEELENQ